MSQPGPTQGSRQLIVGELLLWSLALAQPSVLRGADLPCPGPACGHKSTCRSASYQGGSCGKCFSCQPHLRPSSSGAPVQGGPTSCSLPAAPCQLGPTQQALLSGCLSAGSPAAWDPWDGLGRHSQPVQAQALGPRVTEVLRFGKWPWSCLEAPGSSDLSGSLPGAGPALDSVLAEGLPEVG